MGLLAPDHKDGWTFEDRSLQGVDEVIDRLFATVNSTRDRLRTIEKAVADHGYAVPELATVSARRREIDTWLPDAFDGILTASSREPAAPLEAAHAAADQYAAAHEAWLERECVPELVRDGYKACDFDFAAVDLFRK
jgi:hypothetical protein